MAITKERKAEIVKNFGKDEKDSGSAVVQIALLTEDINSLTEHFKTHKHDFHSRRGLLRKVSQRKSLLKYISENDINAYREVIKKLGLRK